MGAVMEAAAKQAPDISRRFEEWMESMRVEMDELMKQPIPEILRAMNAPDPSPADAFYILAAQVGSSEDPVGAQMAADWYERNLKIYGNIARLAQSPDDLILVLIGAGHAALLREFVELAPNLRLADTLEYLE